MLFNTKVNIENTIKYLCNLETALPDSSNAHILRTYYLTKCVRLAKINSITLPQKFTKSTGRCPRCQLQYKTGSTLYNIKSQCKNRFVRKLLGKYRSKTNLTNFQNTFLKHLIQKENVNAHNQLIITCGVCKHKVVKKFVKTVEQAPLMQTRSVQSKKKRKKDRFSGLNKDVVLSLTPKNGIAASNGTNYNNKEEKAFPVKKIIFSKTKTNCNKIRVQSLKSKMKNKKEKLKGLQNILNNSKQKSPAVNLKNFLNSMSSPI